MAFEVVRVLVALAVPKLGHETRRRVPQVQRDGVGACLREVMLELAEPAL